MSIFWYMRFGLRNVLILKHKMQPCVWRLSSYQALYCEIQRTTLIRQQCLENAKKTERARVVLCSVSTCATDFRLFLVYRRSCAVSIIRAQGRTVVVHTKKLKMWQEEKPIVVEKSLWFICLITFTQINTAFRNCVRNRTILFESQTQWLIIHLPKFFNRQMFNSLHNSISARRPSQLTSLVAVRDALN